MANIVSHGTNSSVRELDKLLTFETISIYYVVQIRFHDHALGCFVFMQ